MEALILPIVKALGSSTNPWFVLLALGGGIIYLATLVVKNTALVKLLTDKHDSVEAIATSLQEAVKRLNQHEDVLAKLDGTMTRLAQAIDGLSAEQQIERKERTHLQEVIDAHEKALGALKAESLSLNNKIMTLQEAIESLAKVMLDGHAPKTTAADFARAVEDDVEQRRRQA